MFPADSLLTNTIGIIVALTLTFISYYKWRFRYWSSKNLNYLEPSIPFGNIGSAFLGNDSIGTVVKVLYDVMKSKKWQLGGAYFLARPTCVLVDLELMKNVLTKDFQHFVDRGIYYNEKSDPISAHLLAIEGTKWKNLRVKLTPTFTSGKMKMMFQTLVDCESNLHEKIGQKGPVDIKDVLGCFTTDIIGSCAFGLDCNTFKDEDSPFRKYGKKAFNPSSFRRLLLSFTINFPSLAKALNVRVIPKDISDFFSGVVQNTVEYRERNEYTRKDFIQQLIDLRNGSDGLTMDEITAQSFVFFLAGFETSSTTMTFALYELAKNQQIQKKLRSKIEMALGSFGGKITYEAVQNMKYMDQVIDETLRKYPPVPFTTRQCTTDYTVPGQDLILEKGTRVVIPIYGIHHDPEYYPDPQKFDPERFNEANSHSRHQYAHLPFGEGPRNCIGMRFGLMQTKVGLASLLRKYNFTVNGRTKEPLRFKKNSFILAAEGDIWLDVQKI